MFFHWDSVPAPDAPRGLCVLHVFAAATGWTKSTLLPTSVYSRVQIRPFCTRQTIFELSRVLIVGFCLVVGLRVQILPFCPRRPSLILSRTAARTVARARSAQGASQVAADYAAVRCAASPDSICSHNSLRKRIRGYVLTGLLLFGKTEQPEIHVAGESVDS